MPDIVDVELARTCYSVDASNTGLCKIAGWQIRGDEVLLGQLWRAL
jgi:hypothetical protein